MRLKNKLTSSIFALAWTLGLWASLTPAHSSENIFEKCTSLFSQIFRKIPQTLPNDESLVALKELYGDLIEIEQRNEGPRIYLRSEPKTRPFSAIKELRIGTYNVMNTSTSKKKITLNRNTAPQQGKIILEENNDILFGQELSSLESAQELNREYIRGIYRPIVIDGNDIRNINITFFVKKDLPFDIEIQSHRQLQKTFFGKKIPVFSRDLPVVLLRPKGASKTDPPFLILIGHHLKSKRDAWNDPGSTKRREIEVTRSLEIKEKLENLYPKVPILSIGDFNGDLRNDPDLEPLWKRGKLKDSFDLATKFIPVEKRITHTFHPFKGPQINSQLDGILVSSAGQKPGIIRKAKIVGYFDNIGQKKQIPTTQQERDKNPSDHYMITTVWDFKKILESSQ